MNKISVTLTKNEIRFGIALLLFQQLLLPTLLYSLSALLPTPMTAPQLNLAFFSINFFSAFLVFGKFLWKSLEITGAGFFKALTSATVGYMGYYAVASLLGVLIYGFYPDFVNLNDTAISEMTQEQFSLMAVGTVLLVPPVEELFFRGLIFGSIYNRKRILAYVVSSVLFSLIHLLGYWNYYTPLQFFLAFLQYLPAGIALGWCYVNSDSIFSPILLHTFVNLLAVLDMR